MNEAFARALIDAYSSGVRFVPDGEVPRNLEEAYAVQHAVSRYFGAIGGFKTAMPKGQPRILAPIRADRCVRSGVKTTVRDRIGVELVVGFLVLGVGIESADDADLTKLVRPVVVIELVDTRVAGPLADDPVVKLADAQVNEGLVIGAELADWDGSDFSEVTARMTCGSDVLVDGVAQVPGGSALTSLRGAAGIAAELFGGLVEGQVVITGSLHPLAFYPGGTEVEGHIEGIGDVSVSLV